jgi:molybdopterin/thiamine biosynthesis adenylyltransferase
MSDRYKRQMDIISSDKMNEPIHIIGCGGIGSWTALVLAKMGCDNIHIYDDDIVEDHNVATQYFKEEDNGKLKRYALADNVYEQTGIGVKSLENIEEEKIDSGIVIFALDSMEERIRLGEIYKDKDIYIIDGRMGGLQLEIYTRPASEYLPTTVAPEKVDRDICTARSICFTCVTIAGLISNFVRQKLLEKIKDNSITFGFEDIVLLRD